MWPTCPCFKSGIPDEAFKELTGDDKNYARDLRKRNKGERENPSLMMPRCLLPSDLAAAIAALTNAPEDTLDAVAEKRTALADIQSGRAAHDLRVACDLWCAAFFAPRASCLKCADGRWCRPPTPFGATCVRHRPFMGR